MPISEVRNDGRDNLLGALILAGQYVVPEVSHSLLQYRSGLVCMYMKTVFEYNRLIDIEIHVWHKVHCMFLLDIEPSESPAEL